MSPALHHFLTVWFWAAAIAFPVCLLLAAWALSALELLDGGRR